MSLRNPDPDIFLCLDLHDESGLSTYVFDSPESEDVLTLRIGTLEDGTDTWEFVMVEAEWRCPTWSEMKFVKDHLWEPEDVCLQLHPQQSRYINKSEFCLWIWRPLSQAIPQPRIWRERKALHTANRLSNVELTAAQLKI